MVCALLQLKGTLSPYLLRLSIVTEKIHRRPPIIWGPYSLKSTNFELQLTSYPKSVVLLVFFLGQFGIKFLNEGFLSNLAMIYFTLTRYANIHLVLFGVYLYHIRAKLN